MPKPTPKPDKAPPFDSPITSAMLHEHIQATIFGRPSGDRGRHFDRLQNKLHELVDRGDAIEVVAAFVERIKDHAAGYLDTEGRLDIRRLKGTRRYANRFAGLDRTKETSQKGKTKTMTTPFRQMIECPNCHHLITAETAFCRWMRNHPDLSSMKGIVRTDADHIIHRFKFDDRDLQAIMIVEVKTYGAVSPDTQRDTLHFINQTSRNRRSNIHSEVKFQSGFGLMKVKSLMTGQDVTLRNFGVHVLRFSHSDPTDSAEIHWDKWPTPITVDQLVGLLRFDLDPDTLRPIDLRIHQRRIPQLTFLE